MIRSRLSVMITAVRFNIVSLGICQSRHQCMATTINDGCIFKNIVLLQNAGWFRLMIIFSKAGIRKLPFLFCSNSTAQIINGC